MRFSELSADNKVKLIKKFHKSITANLTILQLCEVSEDISEEDPVTWKDLILTDKALSILGLDITIDLTNDFLQELNNIFPIQWQVRNTEIGLSQLSDKILKYLRRSKLLEKPSKSEILEAANLHVTDQGLYSGKVMNFFGKTDYKTKQYTCIIDDIVQQMRKDKIINEKEAIDSVNRWSIKE